MNHLDDAVATRKIELIDADGRAEGIMTVAVGLPEKGSEEEWICRYQITGIGADRAFSIIGVDAVQALHLAIWTAGHAVARTEEAKDGRLRWAGNGRPGLPVPQADLSCSNMLLHKGIDDFVATRTVETSDRDYHPSTGAVTVSIGRPLRAPSGEWFCSYGMRGLGVECVFAALGVDAIQAMEGALMAVGHTDEVTEAFIRRNVRYEYDDRIGFFLLRDPPKDLRG